MLKPLTVAAVPQPVPGKAEQPSPGAAAPQGPAGSPCPAPQKGADAAAPWGPWDSQRPSPASRATPALATATGPLGFRADDLGKVKLLENDMPSKNSASPHLYPACRRDLHWPCKPGYSVEALEEFKGRIHLPSSEEARRHMEQLGDTEPSERMWETSTHTDQLQ